jgi:hypothetical protein
MTLAHTLTQKALEHYRQGQPDVAAAYWAAAKNTLLSNRNK